MVLHKVHHEFRLALGKVRDPLARSIGVHAEPVPAHLRVNRRFLLLTPVVGGRLVPQQEFVRDVPQHVNVLLGVGDIAWFVNWDVAEAAELLGKSFQITLLAGNVELEREVVQRQPAGDGFGLSRGDHLCAAAHREQHRRGKVQVGKDHRVEQPIAQRPFERVISQHDREVELVTVVRHQSLGLVGCLLEFREAAGDHHVAVNAETELAEPEELGQRNVPAKVSVVRLNVEVEHLGIVYNGPPRAQGLLG